MAKEKLDEKHVEDDLSSDKYSQVSENIAKELRKADKERGPKAPGVTE
jgi:hypothetical protein